MWKDYLPPDRATTAKELEELELQRVKDPKPDYGHVPFYPPPLEGNENKIY